MAVEPASKISREVVEGVRELLLFARSSAGLNFSRQELCNAAGIRGTDLDNFTTIDRTSETYRTKRPRANVLHRLIRFAACDTRLAERLGGDKTELGMSLNLVITAFRALPAFAADDDHFFLYLKRIYAMDETKCISVCAKLAGNYFGYRFSGTPGRIIRSHFEMKPFDPTLKVPNFIHHMRYESNGPIRRIVGQTIELGTNYVFIGFARSGAYDYEGVKLMVMNRGTFGHAEKLDGTFISYIGETVHQTGFIQLRKTGSRYDPDMVGEYSAEQIKGEDDKFDIEGLKRNVSGLLEDGNLIASLS